MKKTIIPRGRHILVRPVAPESRESKFGIIAPANEKQEQRSEGVIVSLGPEVKDLSIGDEIIYAKFADQDEISMIGPDGKQSDYIILHSDDIKAVWGQIKNKK